MEPLSGDVLDITFTEAKPSALSRKLSLQTWNHTIIIKSRKLALQPTNPRLQDQSSKHVVHSQARAGVIYCMYVQQAASHSRRPAYCKYDDAVVSSGGDVDSENEGRSRKVVRLRYMTIVADDRHQPSCPVEGTRSLQDHPPPSSTCDGALAD